MTKVELEQGSFRFDGQIVEVAPGHSLFRALLGAGLLLPTTCDGGGNCGECVIEILRGEQALDPRTPEEERLKAGLRRACRTHWVRRGLDIEGRTAHARGGRARGQVLPEPD